MDWIAVAGKRGDLESTRINFFEEVLCFAFAGEQVVHGAMRGAGITARADLDRLNSKIGEIVEGFFESLGPKNNGEYAYFHIGARL
jgi:hypothetical protein